MPLYYKSDSDSDDDFEICLKKSSPTIFKEIQEKKVDRELSEDDQKMEEMAFNQQVEAEIQAFRAGKRVAFCR